MYYVIEYNINQKQWNYKQLLYTSITYVDICWHIERVDKILWYCPIFHWAAAGCVVVVDVARSVVWLTLVLGSYPGLEGSCWILSKYCVAEKPSISRSCLYDQSCSNSDTRAGGTSLQNAEILGKFWFDTRMLIQNCSYLNYLSSPCWVCLFLSFSMSILESSPDLSRK